MQIKELTNEQFRTFCKQFPIHTLYQTPEYAFVMNEQGYDSLFLGLTHNNQILAASLILVESQSNFKYAYAPRGFLLDYQNEQLLETFTHEIKKYLGKRNIMAIKINPYFIRHFHEPHNHLIRKNPDYDTVFDHLKHLGYRHMGYNSYFEALKPRFEATISLDVPYYVLFQNIRKEFRTKIRGAEEKGMKVYLGHAKELSYLHLQTKKKYPRDLKYFEDVYRFFQKKAKAEFFYVKLDTTEYLKVITKKYHNQEDICNIINRKLTTVKGNQNQKMMNQKMEADQLFYQYKQQLTKAIRLLQDFKDGLVLASALVILIEKQAYLLIDGYHTLFKSLNAKHLLLWKLCERYAKEGYHSLCLGGITNPDSKHNSYKGLNDFKLGFGSYVTEYIGDLELVTNHTLYFMYKNSAPIRNILKK